MTKSRGFSDDSNANAAIVGTKRVVSAFFMADRTGEEKTLRLRLRFNVVEGERWDPYGQRLQRLSSFLYGYLVNSFLYWQSYRHWPTDRPTNLSVPGHRCGRLRKVFKRRSWGGETRTTNHVLKYKCSPIICQQWTAFWTTEIRTAPMMKLTRFDVIFVSSC